MKKEMISMISGPFLTFHEFKDNFENLLVPLSGEWSDSKKLNKLNIQVVSVI